MVSGTTSLNTASLNSLIFAPVKEIVTRSVLLNATSGYTPAVGDVLVKNRLDDDSHNIFDFDDICTKGTSTLVSAVGTLTNITPLVPGSLRVYSDTAYTTEILLGSAYSLTNAVPATIDISISGTAAITLSAGFSFEFLEDGNQEILGVIYDINDTDTAANTLDYAIKGAVHYSALGTDGTAIGTYKASGKIELIRQLEDMGIVVVQS